MQRPSAERRELRLATPAEEANRPEPFADVDRLLRTCPICGSELAERKCKLTCPRPGCGYFLSCADYY